VAYLCGCYRLNNRSCLTPDPTLTKLLRTNWNTSYKPIVIPTHRVLGTDTEVQVGSWYVMTYAKLLTPVGYNFYILTGRKGKRGKARLPTTMNSTSYQPNQINTIRTRKVEVPAMPVICCSRSLFSLASVCSSSGLSNFN